MNKLLLEDLIVEIKRWTIQVRGASYWQSCKSGGVVEDFEGVRNIKNREEKQYGNYAYRPEQRRQGETIPSIQGQRPSCEILGRAKECFAVLVTRCAGLGP